MKIIDHPKAIEAIGKKCRGVLQNLVISGMFLEQSSYLSALISLSKDVLKIRGKWLDEEDVIKIFYNVILDTELSLADYKKNDGCRFWEIIGEEKGIIISEKLLNYYLSIPRNYDIYFPFSGVKFDITKRIKLTPKVSFHCSDDLLKLLNFPGKENYVSPNTVYLKLKLTGFSELDP